jgi:trimeric autotransporter adhesin
MKTQHLAAALAALLISLSFAAAQGTAFTYQGRLNDGGAPVSGSYSLRFILHNAEFGGSPVGPTLTNEPVSVAAGLFTTTLDFGAAPFNGSPRWLEIAVRSNGVAAFTTVLPRQPLTPTPYAITAGTVVSNGLASGTYGNAVTFNNAANSFTGNGAGLAGVNAAMLGGVSSNGFWRTTGNTGTAPGPNFLGTTDNQPLELKVNGQRALRLEPNTNGAPNVIGGAQNNIADPGVIGAFIGGGGATNLNTGTPNHTNRVASSFSVIAGGYDNLIHTNATVAFIGTGHDNEILGGRYSAIISGTQNVISNSAESFIGTGDLVAILGGVENFVGSGFAHKILSQSAGTIGGGGVNGLGGTTPAGGVSGIISNTFNTIGGGTVNWIANGAMGSTIAGGRENVITGGIIAGTIPGGWFNSVAGDYGFAAGRRAKANHDGAFVWADSFNADFASTKSNQFLIRAAGGVGINTNNPVSALHVNGDVTLGPGSQLLADGGSNAAPGISFAGDSNTGFVHPLANTITFITTGAERMRLESGGFVGIGTNNPTERLHVLGNILATGTITPNSDRNSKTDIKPVDTAAILECVAKIPVQQWRFKAEGEQVKHIGPMAQDFRAAFGLGAHETAIATVDADGVALAAIQGLNQKVENLNDQLKRRDAENAELKQRLEALEKIIRHQKTH